MRTLPRLRQRLGLVAVTPLLLASVAACGSDTADKTASDTSTSTSASASASSDSGSSDSAAPEAGDTVEPDTFVSMIKSGVENMTTAHVTMDMGGGQAALQADGDIDYAQSPPLMAMTMDMGAGQGNALKMEVRMVDGILYMNMGQLSQNKFVKVDPQDPNGPLANMGDLQDSFDPTKAFDSFSQGVKQVTFKGEEDVDGETLEHYVMTLDTSKIAKMGAASAQAGMPKQLDYDVWLDSDHRMRKAVIDLGQKVGTMTMAMDDFGKDVSIKEPPADQITSMPGS
jgi:hypothetical protein